MSDKIKDQRIVVLNADLLLALGPDESLSETFDAANMMLIPLQIKEGGDTLVDYGFNGGPRETGVKVTDYDYDKGLPKPNHAAVKDPAAMKDLDMAECKRLLGRAVAAKLRFWDELHEIEMELADGDFTDKANDAVIDLIDILAAGIDDADSAEQMMEDEHVAQLMKAIKP